MYEASETNVLINAAFIMPDNTPDQEPSIEEILSSIRQIISDDGEAPPEVAREPKPAFTQRKPKDDVLKIIDVVKHDNDVPESEPEIETEPPLPRPVEVDMAEAEDGESARKDAILTPNAAAATLEAFTTLTSHKALDRKRTGAVTIEDVAKQMLRPMLREWLDTNLPLLLEKLVQKELDQLARKAMGD